MDLSNFCLVKEVEQRVNIRIIRLETFIFLRYQSYLLCMVLDFCICDIFNGYMTPDTHNDGKVMINTDNYIIIYDVVVHF